MDLTSWMEKPSDRIMPRIFGFEDMTRCSLSSALLGRYDYINTVHKVNWDLKYIMKGSFKTSHRKGLFCRKKESSLALFGMCAGLPLVNSSTLVLSLLA